MSSTVWPVAEAACRPAREGGGAHVDAAAAGAEVRRTPMMRLFRALASALGVPAKDTRDKSCEAGDHFADMLGAAGPGDGGSFEAEAEPGVGRAAVAAKIEIPLKGFFGELLLAEACEEEFVAGDAFAAAHDFA